MQQLKFSDFLTDKPFSMSRWGDGEFLPVLGFYNSKNADGCDLTPDLGYELRKVIHNDYNYWHGLLNIAYKNIDKKRINRHLHNNTNRKNWYKADSLLNAMLAGEFKPLIEKIRTHKVLYVGAKHLRKLDLDFFDYAHFVEVPAVNAYRQRKKLLEEIRPLLPDIDFIGYSAGMLSNLLIDDIFKTNPEIKQIDFGSSFDGYFDVRKRSYINKVDWKELLKKNS